MSVTNCCAPILLFFQVTSRYYWARVLEDCDETVKRCDVCQRTSKKFEKPSAQLHPIKVKDTVWHRIGIGLASMLACHCCELLNCYFKEFNPDDLMNVRKHTRCSLRSNLGTIVNITSSKENEKIFW